MHALLQWCCLAYLKSSNWKIPSVIWRVNIAIYRFIFYLNNNNRISIITSSTFDHFIWFFNTDSKILVSSHRKSSDSDGWAREMSKLSIPKEESILPAGLSGEWDLESISTLLCNFIYGNSKPIILVQFHFLFKLHLSHFLPNCSNSRAPNIYLLFLLKLRCKNTCS